MPAGRRRAAEDVLSACRIPPRYRHCSLEHFNPGTPSLRAALEKCLRYCNGYPYLGPTDEGLGLLFSGDSGVGKTHLAVSVLRSWWTARARRGQFWDFHELIREIKNSYNPETLTTELQVLAPVVETDVLLLDDLGAWKMTDWMNDTLFYILNSRYMAKRATMITTNYQDADRECRARRPTRGGARSSSSTGSGQRLRSRLMEMCLVIRIEGGDLPADRQSSNEAALGGPARRRS